MSLESTRFGHGNGRVFLADDARHALACNDTRATKHFRALRTQVLPNAVAWGQLMIVLYILDIGTPSEPQN